MRVYRYGLLAPTENSEFVRAQARVAHRYRNVLVEVERRRRAAVRAAWAAHVEGDVGALEGAAERADAAAADAARAVKAP